MSPIIDQASDEGQQQRRGSESPGHHETVRSPLTYAGRVLPDLLFLISSEEDAPTTGPDPTRMQDLKWKEPRTGWDTKEGIPALLLATAKQRFDQDPLKLSCPPDEPLIPSLFHVHEIGPRQ